MISLIHNLKIVCITCFGLKFSDDQIQEFINLVGSYGYSPLHKEFPREFFSLIDYIYIEVVKLNPSWNRRQN